MSEFEKDPIANAIEKASNYMMINGDHYGAIAEWTKLIELYPNCADCYNNRGLSKYQLKDYYGAIADYAKAIELIPNAAFYTNRGASKRSLKDYYGAIADYTKAIELDPNYENAYYNRAIARYNLKDFNGACEDARITGNLGESFDEMIELTCK